MALPIELPVKLSTERAEGIALTPVVVETMTPRALVELMLANTGKDIPRILEILARGTMVISATRYRWEGVEAEEKEIEDLLAAYPDPDPSRRFEGGECFKAVLRGTNVQIDIPKEAAQKSGVFAKRNFWDELLKLGAPVYSTYSYREKADQYELTLDAGKAQAVRDAGRLIQYGALSSHIRRATLTSVVFFVRRRVGTTERRSS